MGKIWVAGVGFDIDAKVVRWDEGPGFNAGRPACINSHHPCRGGVVPYSPKFTSNRTIRASTRPALRSLKDNPTLSAAQAVIKQFVLHHDGCPSAEACFNVLHNERGLSCHFLLDNDGTIYQTLDLAFMAFHAAGFNAGSVGIEMCNRGDAKRDPTYYSRKRQKRDVTTCRIHGHTYLAFDYTEAQYEALRALARGLVKALPNMPAEYPQDSPGYQSWGVLSGVHGFAGILGHYHTTRRKWDPGPFDFKRFCESIRGQRSFPLAVEDDKPDVPDDSEELRAACDKLYRKNEIEGEVGFFPLGPNGESRLWHGGVHLPAPRGESVHAPFAGRVMAARMGGSSTVGSTNFVLMRHDMSVGPATFRFFTLYFHLDDERGREGIEGAPRWLAAEAWAQATPGRTVLLDEPVEAGDVIGRVGMAGPDDLRTSQVHFEVFAAEEVLGQIQPGTFQVIDGTAGGRFAADPQILSDIDTDPADGRISRKELLDFFRTSAKRNLARFYATLHVSEWTAQPSWTEALQLSKDFEGMSKAEIAELVEEQIEPTLWWDDAVAVHARLPRDGVVYHYNPIAFVQFVNEKLQEANVLTNVGVGAFSHDEAEVQPEDVLGDIDDVEGESFIDESELEQEDFGHDLGLSDLADGFPDD